MRFDDLVKLPAAPAARILAQNNVTLLTELEAPVSAPLNAVLSELAGKEARLDMMQLIAHSLPVREATWWACLAARDLLMGAVTSSVKAAEAWVRQPGLETRIAAREALDRATRTMTQPFAPWPQASPMARWDPANMTITRPLPALLGLPFLVCS